LVLTESIFYKKIEDLKDVEEVVAFQEKIWSSDTVTPLPQLVAACHNGGILMGAFDDSHLVGFCYGFPGFKNHETYLISHMAGVLPAYHNRGIGEQLKLKQREWALEYGYKKMVWTYDPLEARNAYFNLNKLGAYAKTYIYSYYGEMTDKLNKGLPTDRLLAEWDLASERAVQTLAGSRQQEGQQYESLIETTMVNGFPHPVEQKERGREKGYLVPIPAHFQDMKKADLETAKLWRRKAGNVLAAALADGYVVTALLRNISDQVHAYVIEKMEVSS